MRLSAHFELIFHPCDQISAQSCVDLWSYVKTGRRGKKVTSKQIDVDGGKWFVCTQNGTNGQCSALVFVQHLYRCLPLPVCCLFDVAVPDANFPTCVSEPIWTCSVRSQVPSEHRTVQRENIIRRLPTFERSDLVVQFEMTQNQAISNITQCLPGFRGNSGSSHGLNHHHWTGMVGGRGSVAAEFFQYWWAMAKGCRI